MKRCKQLILVVCVLLIGVSAGMVYSGQGKKVSDKFRKDFIKNFRRTGLNTTPGDAMMLRILVESAGCKRGVEVGSASGYGAVNMGIAFERTGGHLYTLEIDPDTVKVCRDNIKKMDLEDTVTCIEGDALKTMPKLEGQFDFVFLDAVKSDYLKYLKIIEPKLKPGSVIVGDNVIRSARAMKDFLDYIQNSPDYDTVIIRASMEKKDGMSISYKIR
ncbi:MAG: class I SAM-dependent methyltransferase [Phycisphaerales bacterium]|nr:MAG: class I SAM-dependent methyltransferase [Phycisphaerales bacterium]